MTIFRWFTKQMKGEPRGKRKRWVLSEDKILDIKEVDRLRAACQALKKQGIKEKNFPPRS